MPPLVSLSDVRKTYTLGDTQVDALAAVTLEVRPGEFTVFAGPSGSGKSTLLNLVGCLDRPSAGTVALEGADVATLDDDALGALRARRIGFIFQSFNLIPVLTALENVELALRLAGEARDTAARARRALADVGLEAYVDRRPSQLSGGQQQRVAIARALVKQPAMVIADEPTANLDSRNGVAILELMREMNERQGVTFLFSTHDPMVMERARRVVRLADGRVVGDETLPGSAS
jgi:putative ABC transport system ATP-binding protein